MQMKLISFFYICVLARCMMIEKKNSVPGDRVGRGRRVV